jgi:serine/threonine protein kinase
MEFERALAVANRGIPTATPLGLGERIEGWGPSDSFLITRCLEDTEPLSTFIEQKLAALVSTRQVLVRQRLARELGKFIAQIHQSGILHNDLHAGNILVRLEADDQPRLFLIDLHGVKVGGPLSWNASRANLVVLSHWFMIHAGQTDRLRFWRSYLSSRWASGEHAINDFEIRNSNTKTRFSDFGFRISDLIRELEIRSWKSTLRLWRTRESRYLHRNRAFEPISSGVARGHIVRDLDRPALLGLFDDPDAPFRRPDVKTLKDSPSSTVIEFDMLLDGVPCRVVYKRFRVKSWIDPITAWFRRPAALRSWIFGQAFRECGLATPRPLAVLFRRRWGMSFEGYLLTEKIQNVRELHRFVADLAPSDVEIQNPKSEKNEPRMKYGLNTELDPGSIRVPSMADLPCSIHDSPPYPRQQVLRGAIDQVARLVRDLHRRQLSHRDLKAANILVRGQGSEHQVEASARGDASAHRSEAKDQSSGHGEQLTTDHGPLISDNSSLLPPPSSLFGQPSPSVWLIDLVGVKRHRWLSRQRRVQNLARLHASFFLSSPLTRTDKLRFLRTYLQWGLFGRDGWKRWWHEIEAATRAKIAKNTRLRRPLG